MEVVFRPGQKTFFNTLRNRINQYFIENQITQEGNEVLYSKTIIISTLLLINCQLYAAGFFHSASGMDTNCFMHFAWNFVCDGWV